MTLAIAMIILSFAGALAAAWWQFCAWEAEDKKRNQRNQP